MRYRQARWGLLLGSAVAGVAVLASCAATAGPAPFSASPAPALTPSVVASMPASSPTPVPAQSSATATATATATASAKPKALTTPGGLRTSYPGIKKLVIVRSRWNRTAGGQAAINTVAAYNSYLTTAPSLRTTKPLTDLVSPVCVECKDDIRNVIEIMAVGGAYVSPTGDIRTASVALYVEWRNGSQYMVRADAVQPALQIVDRSRKVIFAAAPHVLATESLVETAGDRARIVQLSAVSQ